MTFELPYEPPTFSSLASKYFPESTPPPEGFVSECLDLARYYFDAGAMATSDALTEMWSALAKGLPSKTEDLPGRP